MGILYGIGILVALLVAPFAILAGMASLALLIWSWGRIGRYFVNFGQWVGDWRAFIPLTIIGTAYLLLIVLINYLLPQLRILWIILLVLHLVVTAVCLLFAMIAWTVWFC